MKIRSSTLCLIVLCLCAGRVCGQPAEQRLANLLKRFPAADTNGDGRLTPQEAEAYRQKLDSRQKSAGRRSGAPREFEVDPGWLADRFPDHAVCYRSPDEIAKIYGSVPSHPKPVDGSFCIVGTGHSFMAPGYKSLPRIAQAAGFKQQQLFTHTGGGMTGSARYKWEQENGIFQFDGKPQPKLLAAISNTQWDVMMWGPYFNDRPAYYACWIDFCLKYNPDMKFYLSDAWPQLSQLKEVPASEDEFTAETMVRMGKEMHATYATIIETLNEKHADKVFVLPTCDAMVLAAQYYLRGELPGVEGIHMLVGKRPRSLWRDHLGHLGPGLGQLEGYVFYATIYGRSPELIDGDVQFGESQDYPSRELDRVFRKIAWQATVNNPRSGVTDEDQDGMDDHRDNRSRPLTVNGE